MNAQKQCLIARNGTNRVWNTGYVPGSRVQAQVTATGLVRLAMRNANWLEHWLDTHGPPACAAHTVTSNSACTLGWPEHGRKTSQFQSSSLNATTESL